MSLRPNISLYQHRGHRQTVAPASEPVTADEMRAQVRETSTTLSDADANDLVATAREYIERVYGVAMIDQTWRLSIDRWPGGREPWWDGVRDGHIGDLYAQGAAGSVNLPAWPLSSITSVTTYDEDGDDTAVTVASVFDTDTYSIPGRLTLRRGQTWPVALRANNAIEIVYVAGYGSSASDVPAPIVRAVKQMAAYLYEHRGDGCSASDAFDASGVAAIMGAYKPRRI